MKWCLFFLLLFPMLTGCQNQPAVEIPEFNAKATAIAPLPRPENTLAPQGRMIFIEVDAGNQYLSQYDLLSEEVTRLWTVPDNAWLSQMAVTPDQTQVMMAYAPPPPAGQIQFGYTNLYLLQLDQSAGPQEFGQRNSDEEVLYNPSFSPEGSYLYYSHVVPDSTDPAAFTNQLERTTLDTGETITIAADGIWPRVSHNGRFVTYVTVEPGTLNNALLVARPDGTEPRLLIPDGRFQVVDVPMFSPDDTWIYFTAAENPPAAVRWWDLLWGLKTAAAHNIPSDWYRIPAAGGQAERLTDVNEVGLYGDFSPDGEYVGFASLTGLHTMRPDGSDRERILQVGASTAFAWIP